MKVLILIHHRFEFWVPPAWFVDRLRKEFPEVEFQQFTDYKAAEPHLPEAGVMIAWSLRPEQFAKAHKLRWIHSTAAAVHALMIPEIVASPVLVTNASSVNGPVVAEHVFALLLAMARRIPSAARYQQQCVWGQEATWRERPQPRELDGANLGLVGAGAIGGRVAQLALAFGMKVLAIREHPERGTDFLDANTAARVSGRISVCGFNQLDEVLANSDFLVLAAPVTPKTRALLDARRLALMKSDVVLVNVGRGALIDEGALIDALRRQRLGGAALDVFEREPLPPDSPFWSLPNVLITPHTAGISTHMWERQYALFAENLRCFQAGKPLTGVVDKQKGY
jgi:phosphoglycerate dehydrogenase-like enzyme